MTGGAPPEGGPPDGVQPPTGQPPAGRADVEQAVGRVSRALLAHAGGLELVEVTGTAVHVRFTGACTGCPARPLTYAATVRPALSAVPGVTAVVADGVRLDAEQEERLARWAERGARL